MAAKLKIRKIGNSMGLTLPKEVVEQMSHSQSSMSSCA